MKRKRIDIEYFEYDSIGSLAADDRILAEEAVTAMSGAYAPYSNFSVGAAVRMSDGSIIRGSNQENAAFPSGTCAERVALFYAGASHPQGKVTAIAIAGGKDGLLSDMPVTPCGACRQVMSQVQLRAGQKVKIILVGASRVDVFEGVESLLPMIFDSI